MKKKLIIFIPSIEDGGVEKNLYIVSNYFNNKGINVNILTSNHDKLRKFQKGIKFIGLTSPFLYKRGRLVKYLVEGIMVAIAAYVIPKKSLNVDEIVLIALSAAAIFSILDTYIPSMGVTARSGAGFGIGANLVQFPRMM